MRLVGRNDPCPCGSGKKYKKCHLPLDGEQRYVAAPDDLADDDTDDEYSGPVELDPSSPFAALAALGDDSGYQYGHDGQGRRVCTIFEAHETDLPDLTRDSRRPIKAGDWIVSTEKEIVGPFTDEDAAFDYAHTQLGVVRLVSGLEFG